MLPAREVRFAPRVHWSHRRPLGLGPAPLLAVAAAALFVLAIALLAVGAWLPGALVGLLCVGAVTLFVVAVRREPEATSARVATAVADRAESRARLTLVVTRASARTAMQLARLFKDRLRLRRQLRRSLSPLGEAVYRDDHTRASEIKAQAHVLDGELEHADRQAAAAMAALHAEIEHERAKGERTERIPVARRRQS